MVADKLTGLILVEIPLWDQQKSFN